MQVKHSLRVSKVISLVRPGSVFADCSELPLFNFIKAVTTGDLVWLVKSGHPSNERLEKAWHEISNEYSELSDSKQASYLLTLLKDFHSLPLKIEIIQAIVDRMRINHDPELAKRLNRLGFRFSYAPGDSLKRELDLTITQAKSLVVKYENTKANLQKLNSEGEPAQQSDFDDLLAELSKYMGYRLDPKSMSVSEFCAIVKKFKRENKPKK